MLEGTVVSVQAKGSQSEPPSLPGGEGHSRSGHHAPNVAAARESDFTLFQCAMLGSCRKSLAKPDVYYIDTSNVLFIVSGAFVGLDTIIRQRLSKGVRLSISVFKL